MKLRKTFAPYGAIVAALVFAAAVPARATSGEAPHKDATWIGTWAASAQPSLPGAPERYNRQTLRLIVHASASGPRVRIRLSNTFGDRPLTIGAAHIARRVSGADIDAASDRALSFGGHASITVAPHAAVLSDPVDLEVPALSDLAVSLFLSQPTTATTSHLLALQTSYVSTAGDASAAARFPVARKISSWPFLTGVDVEASPKGSAIVAFGDSTVDGDGASADANRRWPDVLAARLHDTAGRSAEVGLLNEGIIGNRLLRDAPIHPGNPAGPALGPSALSRFERDVLGQAGVKMVILRFGLNDIGFPGAFASRSEQASADELAAGFRVLIARAHQQGLRVIGTTLSPFEGATLAAHYYSPDKEALRQALNAWMRSSGAFDAVLDLDEVLRDPDHPARLLPAYDSGDHIHPNDAGYQAMGNAIPFSILGLP